MNNFGLSITQRYILAALSAWESQDSRQLEAAVNIDHAPNFPFRQHLESLIDRHYVREDMIEDLSRHSDQVYSVYSLTPKASNFHAAYPDQLPYWYEPDPEKAHLMAIDEDILITLSQADADLDEHDERSRQDIYDEAGTLMATAAHHPKTFVRTGEPFGYQPSTVLAWISAQAEDQRRSTPPTYVTDRTAAHAAATLENAERSGNWRSTATAHALNTLLQSYWLREAYRRTDDPTARPRSLTPDEEMCLIIASHYAQEAHALTLTGHPDVSAALYTQASAIYTAMYAIWRDDQYAIQTLVHLIQTHELYEQHCTARRIIQARTFPF